MDIPTLDKCPGYNLYIGAFIALRRPKALKSCRITHIVSVLEWQFEKDTPLLQGYQHLHIPVDDVEDENLLEWFPRSNAFIHDALTYWQSSPDTSKDEQKMSNLGSNNSNQGNGVLIHCAMGKSRSATVLIAYLLWASRQAPASTNTSESDPDMVTIPQRPLSVIEALTLLRQGRGIAEPNEGFMDQLHLYVDMGCPTTDTQLKSHKIYKRWMNKRNITESLRINRAPEMDDIVFEDDDSDSEADTGSNQQKILPGISAPDGTSHGPPKSKAHAEQARKGVFTPPAKDIKCRKCRRLLARSTFILDHTPPSHRDPSSNSDPKNNDNSKSGSQEQQQQKQQQCAHIFLHPLSWMKATLSEGQLDGRLTCPNERCGANIGKFAWQGLRCSCGGWVTPGFGVARSKVDEVAVRNIGKHSAGSVRGGESSGADENVDENSAGVRMPPGMRKGNL